MNEEKYKLKDKIFQQEKTIEELRDSLLTANRTIREYCDFLVNLMERIECLDDKMDCGSISNYDVQEEISGLRSDILMFFDHVYEEYNKAKTKYGGEKASKPSE